MKVLSEVYFGIHSSLHFGASKPLKSYLSPKIIQAQ